MSNSLKIKKEPTFTAKIVGRGNICVRNNWTEKWSNMPVRLVKFDVQTGVDRSILSEVVRLWKGSNSISQIWSYISFYRGPQAEVLGLVKGGKKIEAKNILGLMATEKFESRKNIVPIYNIATSPQYAFEQHHSHRTVKHIARELYHVAKAYIGKTYKKSIIVEYAYPNEVEFLTKIKANVLKQGTKVLKAGEK